MGQNRIRLDPTRQDLKRPKGDYRKGERMLALTRRPGESVLVGRTVITVVKVDGRQVRLSFDGPDRITRTELWEKESEGDANEEGAR
jgi:carbon storage regulator CsrA